ncbi:MAG: nuclease A inhibitor family protein [Acidobacteriota bacterium]|nr:nuclease A inhibitor family protein [Acidobacteriota bacterium]
MPKRKKLRKLKENKLEIPKKKVLEKQKADFCDDNLTEQIKIAVRGLYYISETDAEIQPFVGKQAKAVSRQEILSQTNKAADSTIEEKDFARFFARLTEIQDWFGDEEKEIAQKFVQLKELLEKNLRDLKVFKIGKIQLDVYVVGLDAKNNLLGIETKAVET